MATNEKMNRSVKIRLKLMMFLIFAFNGIWIIPLGTYLDSVGYSAANIGSAYMTFAIGCIVSPFFVGMIADRFFAAEKVMAVLILLSSGLLLAAARLSVGPDGLAHVNADNEPVLGAFYWVLLAHFCCYMPTWALANSISFRQMSNPGKEFPGIRVLGTIGWIVVSMTTLFSAQINEILGTSEPFEKSVIPMYFGAGIGLVTGLFCFFLPATPPQGAGKRVTFGDILGVKAFALFKDRGFAVFALTSFLILFPGMFYWAFANLYLNESGMKAAAAWQSTGQMTEMVFLFIMPWFFARFGVKKMLMIGLIAWIARFLCFSFGVWGTPTAFLVVLGLMLHGPCYDFFFVTGQLYTDKKAPREIRSQAQGFLFLITFGLGWFFGSYVAGWVVDHYALGDDGHTWSTIWLWPIGMVALIIVVFSIGFNDKTRVGDEIGFLKNLMECVMGKYLLGIDNGSTMSKAALFDTSGRELACASRKVQMLEPHPGWSERDAKAVWEDTADAIREVIETAGVDSADISAVACTGHGNGLYLVDETGQPVRNAINSMDSRAAGYVEQWIADGVDAKALPRTTQCIWPAQPTALLAWLREHEPETMAKACWILFAKDFVRTQLTGELCMELTDMSGAGLMNVVTGEYDDEVLALFGLLDMKRLLPPLRKTHDICGAVTAEAAARTGLAEGTPVAGGMFDIDACALASGIIDEAQMSLVAGTWGNNQYIAREPLIDKDLYMTSCYSVPGWYLMLEGSPTSAGNLEWFVDRFFAAEREQGEPVFQLCDEAVAAIDPVDHDIIFLPFLYGTNEKSAAKSSFLGLEGRHTRADILRAVYEGIVFSHNHHLQRLLQFRDKPECIRMTGGAARSEVWVQMFADCFQIPVEIPAGTELGALGAAIAAAVATGVHPGYREAVGAMTSIARRYEPDPLKGGVYAEKYRRYKKAVSALDAVWK